MQQIPCVVLQWCVTSQKQASSRARFLFTRLLLASVGRLLGPPEGMTSSSGFIHLASRHQYPSSGTETHTGHAEWNRLGGGGGVMRRTAPRQAIHDLSEEMRDGNDGAGSWLLRASRDFPESQLLLPSSEVRSGSAGHRPLPWPLHRPRRWRHRQRGLQAKRRAPERLSKLSKLQTLKLYETNLNLSLLPPEAEAASTTRPSAGALSTSPTPGPVASTEPPCM